ncbi:g8634 [Coccomyxa elongata]
MPWAEKLLVTVSGLSREERNAVKVIVEGAGGRYTPSLSRRCTHLVVSHDADAASSRKLALALHNEAKWRTHIVTQAWITACSEGGMHLPEQDFAAPVLQEHAPAHGPSGQQNSSHAAQSQSCTHQQSAPPSCNTPTAAVPGAAAAQASGPAFARRHGIARCIAHPAQQPLQQLPGGNNHHHLPDSAICRVHMYAPPPSAISASSGASISAPQQVAAQSRASQWLTNQQQQLRLQLVHQPRCGLHQPMSTAASINTADGSSNSSRGADLSGAQLAYGVEAPARSVHLSGGVLEGRAGACAEGVPTGACGATARTGSGGVSLGDLTGWAPNACTNGLAAKLAALCHSKNSLASTSTHNRIPWRRDAPAAPDLKHLPAQSSTPGCSEALKAQLATMSARQYAHNHSCATISRHSTGDGKLGAEKSENKTVDSQVSRNAVGLARSNAPDQSVVVSRSRRLLAEPSTELVASTSGCVRCSSAAVCDARLSAGPQPCADQREHAEAEEGAVLDQQIGPQQGYAAEQTPSADAPSLESGTWQQHEPEIAVNRGVFHGMRAVLDSSLDPSEASRVREAIVAGEGECATGGFLGDSASHVICSPRAAAKWLAMGVHVVSAAWVLQSAKTGTQERCLLLSADALRGLPLAHPDAQETQHSSDVSADAAARSASTCATGAHAWQALLDQADQRASAMSHHYQTPTALLEDVVWAVTDPPEKARLDSLYASYAEGPEEDQGDVVPDSEDEQETPGQEDRMSAGDWDHAVFSAAAITVLFPADAAGALCHISRTLRCDAPGPSRRHLLAFVHAFYQERLTVAELSEALQGGLRCSSEVRGALLAGRGVRRGDLLGSRRNFEGLSRVSRCRNALVYELNVSC